MSGFIVVENDAGAFVDVIAFDAIITENHVSSSTVTQHPVEDGVKISDHVRLNSRELSLEVLITNHPIKPRFDFSTFASRGQFAPTRLSPPTSAAIRVLAPKRLELPVPFNVAQRFPGISIASPGAGTRIALAALERRLSPPIKVASLLAEVGKKPAQDLFPTLLTFPDHDHIQDTYQKLLTLQTSAQILRVITTLGEYGNRVIENVTATGSKGTFNLTFRHIKKVSPTIVASPKVPAEPNGAPSKNSGGKALEDKEKNISGVKVAKSLLVILGGG